METQKTILQQLGGNRFVAMTGCRDFIADNSGKNPVLRMRLTKNLSGCNKLEIEYNRGLDLYNMKFYRITINSVFPLTRANRNEMVKISREKEYNGIYADQLAEIFERHTGLRTKL